MQRDRIVLRKGYVYINRNNDTKYEFIDYFGDGQQLIMKNVVTRETEKLGIEDLENIKDSDDDFFNVDLSEISDEELAKAEEKYKAIEPLLLGKHIPNNTVPKRAEETGIPARSLYRWLSAYQKTSSIIGLLDYKRGWTKGRSRLNEQQEKVIAEVIENFYLTKVRPTIEQTCKEVYRICLKQNIEKPAKDSIRLRIKQVSEKEALSRRGKRELARNRFNPTPYQFPDADKPLRVVQIDHTPVDLILVDNKDRKPIGRPYLTLAIDVYSRVVTGYYLSLDAPSVTSVAMCVARSILPKESLLSDFNIDAEWKVFGYPYKIHVDNGSDFRSKTFAKACQLHNIQLEFRPVARPRYGGHIERLMGTFMREVHSLNGTTFSNIQKRDGYNSVKEASFTLDEFESWLLTFITKVYNKRMHSAINMSPYAKWEIGIYGDEDAEGIGVPPYPTDSKTLLLDFMPEFERTVQHFGVTIDGLKYYDTCLNFYINQKDEKGKKKEFIFRRDPRDISKIWFYDPQLKEYFPVNLADRAMPSMSLWEYKQARSLIKAKGQNYVNEHQVYEAITELREANKESGGKTQKARRQAQRKKAHEKAMKQIDKNMLKKPSNILESNTTVSKTQSAKSNPKTSSVGDGLLSSDLEFTFGEIE